MFSALLFFLLNTDSEALSRVLRREKYMLTRCDVLAGGFAQSAGIALRSTGIGRQLEGDGISVSQDIEIGEKRIMLALIGYWLLLTLMGFLSIFLLEWVPAILMQRDHNRHLKAKSDRNKCPRRRM